MVKEMEDERQWIQVGPCHIQRTKGNLTTRSYKQCTQATCLVPISYRRSLFHMPLYKLLRHLLNVHVSK
jgi:hypothetical protein